MTADEIIKVLEKLIGATEAVGDSAIDHNVEANLKTLIDVTNWCLEGVNQSSLTRHRYEWSMRDVGERAYSAMAEWRDWLTERLDQD